VPYATPVCDDLQLIWEACAIASFISVDIALSLSEVAIRVANEQIRCGVHPLSRKARYKSRNVLRISQKNQGFIAILIDFEAF